MPTALPALPPFAELLLMCQRAGVAAARFTPELIHLEFGGSSAPLSMRDLHTPDAPPPGKPPTDKTDDIGAVLSMPTTFAPDPT